VRQTAFGLSVCLNNLNRKITRELKNKMSVNHETRKTARVRSLFVAPLVLGCAFGTVTPAGAERVAPPTTPNAITPPAGNSAFLVGHAVGTQGYICLPTSTGASSASWTVNASRPEATLFVKIFDRYEEVVTHFLSPNTNPNKSSPTPLLFGNATWQSSFDNSKVWAQALQTIPAGSDPSCPNTGAIACLLLQSIGSKAGLAGGNFLTQTTFIQRLNTQGGSAPDTGCSVLSDVGKQTLVPYTADYYFFHGNE
jgi:hypothetical protein